MKKKDMVYVKHQQRAIKGEQIEVKRLEHGIKIDLNEIIENFKES